MYRNQMFYQDKTVSSYQKALRFDLHLKLTKLYIISFVRISCSITIRREFFGGG